jgi:phosphate:Na+ symporter
VSDALWRWDPNPASAVTTFHLAFNAVLAVACIGTLGPAARILSWMFPEKLKHQAEIVSPLFLDTAALETPYLALANAAREILRMGDLVDAMLRLVPMAMSTHDKTTAAQATRLGRELDTLHEAVKSYLAKLDRADLTERDTVRLSDLIEFAVNIGHAGDMLERRIALAASRPEAIVGDLDRDAALRIQARVGSELKLALSTMMTEDQRSARELIDAKRAVNDAERMASRDHLARLGGGDEAALGASSPFLSMLRDLKMVNSHLASIGYAVLEPRDRTTSVSPVTETSPHSVLEDM